MSETFYRRIQTGNRARYEPVTEPDPVTVVELTDSQCVTAAGALGVTLLILFERHFPPHKRVARKIKAVETAVLDLFAGTGEEIDEEIADLFCSTWDRTMREISVDATKPV